MNENVKAVFNMIGVEEEEVFTLKGNEHIRYYIDVRLNLKRMDGIETEFDLCDLLYKSVEIIKLPKEPPFIELMNWKPKENEIYWFVNQYGEVCRDNYCDDKETEDYQYLYANSKIYPTEEMAERKKEIMEKYHELGPEFTIEEWQDNNIYKYYLIIDHSKKEVSYDCCNVSQISKYTFANAELVEQFIKFLGSTSKEQYENACLYL